LKEMWVKSLYSFVFLRYKVVWVTIWNFHVWEGHQEMQ
jgi:hypothetical protein